MINAFIAGTNFMAVTMIVARGEANEGKVVVAINALSFALNLASAAGWFA